MTIDFGGHRPVLLDCCSLLNLYASRRMMEGLQAVPVRCVVVDIVVGEAGYVLRGGGGEDASEREPVDLQPLVAQGSLEVWQLETEAEYASFIGFAAEIDDGEAATCALALHRAGIIVTDDRKTHRIMARSVPEATVITTSQLLKYWADARRPDDTDLRAMLHDIQTRARFVPGKQDPLIAWWEALVRA